VKAGNQKYPRGCPDGNTAGEAAGVVVGRRDAEPGWSHGVAGAAPACNHTWAVMAGRFPSAPGSAH